MDANGFPSLDGVPGISGEVVPGEEVPGVAGKKYACLFDGARLGC